MPTKQPNKQSMRGKIAHYIETWKARGYPDDIPDEVPDPLMQRNLAPSYKAICVCILKNDHHLTDLGYSAPKSKWYDAIKQEELRCRKCSNADTAEKTAII